MPHMTVSQAATQLAKQGVVSQPIANWLSRADRQVQLPDLERPADDPVMACMVIDASPSMNPYRAAVIQGQKEAIAALRDSAKCRHDALYIGQWLFSSDSTILNPFSPLHPNGADDVVLLDTNRYEPEKGELTALYKTVYEVLQEMAVSIAHARNEGVRLSFIMAVLTDGEDNKSKESNVRAEDVKAMVEQLRAKKYIKKSLVIGVDSPALPPQKIAAIQQALGFDQAIPVGQSAKGIREAFELWSKSIIDAGK